MLATTQYVKSSCFLSVLLTSRFLFILAKRCDDGNNGGCGRQGCVQTEAGVNCSCNVYNSSNESNMLAKGRAFNEPSLNCVVKSNNHSKLPIIKCSHVTTTLT